ncbi:Universal stress protein in QAH/OAS sulfhydrylase 3'region [Clonorchis sinensis]|uniref:Universal stress protein in QAH/OAS sulfhydrylase 3'region n=2 Tax=Clonorchis sinensis TaxID=79923 RepID=G7YT52_CLOSI|nr:Universal stress protein in QAH/OAS sulfhydrylase 3'region [Clonorchis sinensis]GAA56132.1 universal stress protein in QAH/OAS sulfhydrylase 3'region [Clonorchis sinensis]
MSTEKRMSVSVTNAARRICLPVDGSAHSSRAVEWYLAELYKPGDFIIFVHSLEAPNLPTVTVGAGLSLPIDSWTKALQENIDQTNKLRNEYGYLCESRRIPHDFAVMNGSRPGDGIIQAVEQYNANMIVMGCRGLGAIKRAFLGSVSDYVLHHADVPCIIVPSQGQ